MCEGIMFVVALVHACDIPKKWFVWDMYASLISASSGGHPVVQHDIVIVGAKDTSCSLPAKAQAKEMSTQRSISAPRFVIAQRR